MPSVNRAAAFAIGLGGLAVTVGLLAAGWSLGVSLSHSLGRVSATLLNVTLAFTPGAIVLVAGRWKTPVLPIVVVAVLLVVVMATVSLHAAVWIGPHARPGSVERLLTVLSALMWPLLSIGALVAAVRWRSGVPLAQGAALAAQLVWLAVRLSLVWLLLGLLYGVVPAWLMVIVIVGVMLMLQAVIESEWSLLFARRRAASVPSAVVTAKAEVEAATRIHVDGPIVVDRQDELSAQITWRLLGRPVLVMSTAMARLDPAALTAVIAHEYAHVSLGHLSTRLWVSIVTAIVAVFAIGFLVPVVGVDDAPRPIAMLVLMSVVVVGQQLVLNALIRRQEREADTFAASVAGADAMRAALAATPGSGLPPAFSMWTTHDAVETRENTVAQRAK